MTSRRKENRMKIKYHDNTASHEIPPDGSLSDNWDSTANYGNEYVNAYFRINTPTYDPHKRWNEEDIARFDAESTAVFDALGWIVSEPRSSGGCATVRKGKSHLYLHPQEFSGEVLKNEVAAIAEALTGAKTFSLRWVDLYETVYDMTDEAYIAYLDGQRERIRTEILKSSVTTRRSKFYRDYDVACHVAAIVRLRRIGEDDGRHGGAGKTANYIIGVIEQLIAEGYLATATSRNGSRLIRTINKAEQKQKKLYVS